MDGSCKGTFVLIQRVSFGTVFRVSGPRDGMDVWKTLDPRWSPSGCKPTSRTFLPFLPTSWEFLKTFVRLQMIGHLINDKKISCGTTILKSVEERGLCQDIQRHNGSCITGKKVYKSLGKDELFLVCLRKQSVLRPGTHTCTHHYVIFLCTC